MEILRSKNLQILSKSSMKEYDGANIERKTEKRHA